MLKLLLYVQYGIKTRFTQFRATVLPLADVGKCFGPDPTAAALHYSVERHECIPGPVGGRLLPSAACMFITWIHTALDGRMRG
jgi:hypothetical protein